TFLPDPEDGVIVMEANHYAEKKDVGGVGFVHLEGHGRSGNGMKVLPSTEEFQPKGEKPELIYRFMIPEEGKYRVELWTSPVNSVVNNRALRVHLENGTQSKNLNVLNPSYRGGDYNDPKWSAAVMNQIHVVGTDMNFEQGTQFLSIGALGMQLLSLSVLHRGGDAKEKHQSHEMSALFAASGNSLFAFVFVGALGIIRGFVPWYSYLLFLILHFGFFTLILVKVIHALIKSKHVHSK
ncbi:MAG: hypothetical protein IK034_01690, partial [Bacilli bacterium]|nr:hypothetical protein [Bacilli bacterium]